MTTLAKRILWDYYGDKQAAKRLAERVARAYRMSGQPGDAIEYEEAARSIQNQIECDQASALSGSFGLGMTC